MVTIYFDGECAFCVRSLAWLRRADRDGVLLFHDANDPLNILQLQKIAKGPLDIRRSMWAVVSSDLHEGYHAFRVAFLAVGGLGWLGRLMGLPPLLWGGPLVYQIIARNRRHLGCRI